MIRWARALVLALFLLGPLAIASASAATVLRRASPVEPETLDPQKSAGTPEQMIELDLFEGLTAYDAAAHVIPGVASRWDVSPDGLTWTFHLRPDAKWSDGTAVTAEDFVASFQRLLDPATASPSAEMFEVLTEATPIISGAKKSLSDLGVTAVDRLTLRVTLVHPMPLLPDLLATGAALPVNRAAIAKYGDQWTRPGNMISNGPYRLTAWAPQVGLVLTRNDAFHDAKSVAFDEVHWVVAEDDQTALKRYRANELDIARVPASEFDWAQRTLADHLHVAPQYGIFFLSINMRQEPLASNLKLRTALSMAIDREVLTQKVEPAGEIAAYSFVTGGIAGYEPQTLRFKTLSAADRLAAARKLFAESGAGKAGPLKLTVVYTTDRDRKRMLLAIADMWKECCGVELTMVNREWQVFLTNLRQRDFQIAYDSVYGSYGDAYDVLSGYQSTAGEINDAGYTNPAYDALLDRASATADAAERGHLLGQAERLLIDDSVLLPLNFPVYRALVNPRIRGWQENLLSLHPSRFLSE